MSIKSNHEKNKRVTLEHFLAEFRTVEKLRDEQEYELLEVNQFKIRGAFELAEKLGIITQAEFDTLQQFSG